jgi:hypothetical protein
MAREAKMRIFIVTMLRYGNKEGHHYIIGTYADLAKAYIESLEHKQFRGGKYEPLIQETIVDGDELAEVPIRVAHDYAKLKYPDRFDANDLLIESQGVE